MAHALLSIVAVVEQITQTIQDALKAVETLSQIQSQKDQKLTAVEFFDLSSLQHQLRFGKTKIDTWKELWIIGDDRSEIFFSKLWGEDGRTKVFDLLTMSLHESSWIVTHMPLVVNQRDNPKTASPKRNVHLKWLRKYPKDDSMTTGKQSGQTVDVLELKNRASSLVKHLGELWNDTELYFRQLHAPSVISEFFKVQSLSTAFYDALERLNHPLYLDLQFLRSQQDIVGLSDFFEQKDATLSFHCMFQSPRSESKAQNLVLRTAGPLASTQSNCMGRKDRSAVELLRLSKIGVRSHSSFLLPIKSDTEKQSVIAEGFPSSPFQKFQTEDHLFRSAWIDRPPHRPQLTLSRKFLIANQLAEATLVLLGSPWLHGFSSESIRYLRVDEAQYSLCLYMDWNQTNSSNRSSQFQAIQQQQIFTLGLLLLELALENPIHQRWKDGEDSGRIWRDYQSRYGPEVERKMGTSYGKACEFCFFETVMESDMSEEILTLTNESDDSLFDLQELVEGYHAEVFTRLRKIMNELRDC